MKPSDSTKQERGKNGLEWAVFGLSSLLVAGVLATLIHAALTVGSDPARLEITLGEPLVSAEQIRVPVKVFNHGDVAASSIEIEVTGEIASGPQISGVTVNFIPKRASRSAWVSFSGGEIPRGLSARILGYEDL